MLTVITPPSTLVVSLEEAREHLRAPADDNALVERAIRAATGYVQTRTCLILAPTTLEWAAEDWPSDRIIELPRAPVRDVVSLTYRDEDGVDTEVDAANYLWYRGATGANLVLKRVFSAPALWGDDPHPIRVRFLAGFNVAGASGSGYDPVLDLPQEAVQAVLLQAQLDYERGALSEQETRNIERARESKIAALRVYR